MLSFSSSISTCPMLTSSAPLRALRRGHSWGAERSWESSAGVGAGWELISHISAQVLYQSIRETEER